MLLTSAACSDPFRIRLPVLLYTSASQILAWVPNAEDAEGYEHQKGFKNPKHPLMCQTVTISALGIFGHPVYTTDLEPI